MGAAPRFVSVVLAMLLAVTMLPAGGLQNAYADEPVERPATSGGDVALESANGGAGIEVADGGLLYTVADGVATLVGFEDGAALEGALAVPETVTDGTGTATVKAVEIAEGQVADKVTALALPQAVESVKTEGLASAFPMLASIEVASGTVAEGDVAAGSKGAAAKGAYSSVAGMLFRSAEGQASSDGEAFAEDALELVWAPPAMVVARIPLECKAIAAGAFVDAAAIETVMSFGKMESIASAERDGEGNVTKPGAFTDEQIGRLTIVVPGTNYAVTSESAERVSGSVALSEKIDMLEKRKTWFHYGFDTEQIIMGAPFGEIEGVIGVDDEGKAEDRSLITPLQNGKGHLDLTPEEQAEVDARKAAEPKDGLSFSYQASMDLSVRWAGDKTATPAHIEIPAYVAIDDVTYQVPQIEPSAFEGAVFLTSVAIPEGVIAIGESAFAGCTNLKEVNLPSTLKTIDYAAFKGTALESIDIPESVRIIGGEAFAECVSLQSANVSRGTYVSQSAFSGAPSSSMQMDADTSPDVSQPVVANESITPYATFGPADGYAYEFVYDTSNFRWADTPYAEHDEFDARVFYSSPSGISAPAGYKAFEGSEPFYVAMAGSYWYTDDYSHSMHAKPDPSRKITSGAVSISASWGNNPGRAQLIVDKNVTYSVSQGTYIPHNPTTPFNTPIYEYCIAPSDVRYYNGSTGQLVSGRASFLQNTHQTDFYVFRLITYSMTYADAFTDDDHLRSEFTVEDADKHLVDPADDARPGYRFVGWTGPGNPTTPKKGSEFNIDVTGVTGEELAYTAHWDKQSTISFKPGNGSSISNISYYKGDAQELPKPERTGFWFKGWHPTDTSDSDGRTYWEGVKGGIGDDVTKLVTSLAADAEGDVTLTAVWKPKAYTVKYNTDASKEGVSHDGALAVEPPGNKSFLHPDANDAINAIGEESFGGIHVDAEACYDLTSVPHSMVNDYDFGRPDTALGAYPFQGWCKNVNLPIGTIPDPVETSDGKVAQHWTVLREKNDEGKFTSVNYFFFVFGPGWSNYSEAQCAQLYEVYGVWGVTGETVISLAATQPSYVNNIGEQAVAADGRGDAPRGTETIRFRENMGYIGQSAATADSDGEQLHTGTPERHDAGYEIDAAMGLRAPVRYGFEFLGWGAPASASTDADAAKEGGATVAKTTDLPDVEGKIYVSYDEDRAREAGKTGFALTEAGAALVDSDADAGTHSYVGTGSHNADAKTDSWSAYWRTRTVDVALRVPLHAVAEADMTGASTGPGATHGDAADFAAGVTKGEYDDYTRREGTSAETGGGATAGWYIASRTWRYGDLLEYPAFKTQPDRYTYDGWYHLQKPSVTDSTDKALEDLAGTGADLTKVATYQAMKALSQVRVTGGNTADGGAFATDAGLDVGDAYFTVGDPSAKNAHDGGAAVELWLWTSPVRINVASPLGVWLCTTNSYGQAVEPYVVGNDRRTQLEAQAEFQVSTSSHDLQLVDVTAEDIIAYAYNDDKTVNADSVISQANPTAPDEGICDKIMNPKFGVKDAGDNRYEDETSRMFWVSPVPTATADQTGVVYRSEGLTAAEAASKVSTTPSMTDAETLLEPDVATRRYFGFGSKDAGGNADNRITDELSSEHGNEANYELGDFILRKSYVNGVTDGLAKTSEEGGVSKYRFYYGLDMRRADFDLAGLQDVIDNGGHGLAYNAAFDQPLLRVKFTFAAARNPGISYYSARLSDGEAEAYDAFAEAAGGKISDAVEISAGAPTDL